MKSAAPTEKASAATTNTFFTINNRSKLTQLPCLRQAHETHDRADSGQHRKQVEEGGHAESHAGILQNYSQRDQQELQVINQHEHSSDSEPTCRRSEGSG